jgi:DNA gyrase subunit A
MAFIENIKNEDLFVISEKGYGKRVKFSEFAAKGRGGKGMTYMKPGEKNGNAVSVATVKENAEIIITTQKGMVMRSNGSDISLQGRSATGVRIVNLNEGDMVSAVTSFYLE